VWRTVRRVWAFLGTVALVGFAGWMLIAYRATDEARAAFQGNDRVGVEDGAHFLTFRPRTGRAGVGLLFFPGALVDPVAYAPLALHVAEAGYPVLIVRLPRRGAFGGADGPGVLDRARGAMESVEGVRRWVVGGHSRGGAVAARLVHTDPSQVTGLVLIGTSHPRDFSLAQTPVPVTRVYGTRDTVADVEKLEATRSNLPPATRLVPIEGGNHSQFGHLGFLLGDSWARIPREEQQRLTRRAVTDALEVAAAEVQ
jgi:pimeloyl-ACP methyl ester carboxylesterase